MKETFSDLDLWLSEGEDIAVATVVEVRRSAPRPPGARMLLTRSGRMSGSVSGGCVEADVFERALQVLESRIPEVVNYGIADELGFQVGLSCGGSIDVLIEPFIADGAWDALRGCVENGQTAVSAVGLAPGPLVGRKWIRLGDGGTVGSIDPEVDSRIAAEGAQLRTGETKIITTDWQGGQARVFLEAIGPPPSLVIVGATHAGSSLCRMADEIGFQVTVIDVRKALATTERFPHAERLVHAWPEDALAQESLGKDSSLVVLTHDPKFDIPALASALKSEARYIGAQGSRVTHRARKGRLSQMGFSDDDIARIRAPIGLDIGSRSPAELALSILAEVLAVQRGKD